MFNWDRVGLIVLFFIPALWQGPSANPTLFSQNLGDGCEIKSLAAAGAFSVPVNNRLAGRDPAPAILKRLRLEIRGYGRQRTLEMMEGEILALPAGVKVIGVRYGNLDGENADASNEKGDPSTFHYTVIRESKDIPWKLLKAWRTGANDRIIEEY